MKITIAGKEHFHVTVNTPALFERCSLSDKSVAALYFASVCQGVHALFGLSTRQRDSKETDLHSIEALDLHDIEGAYQGEIVLSRCVDASCAVFSPAQFPFAQGVFRE